MCSQKPLGPERRAAKDDRKSLSQFKAGAEAKP